MKFQIKDTITYTKNYNFGKTSEITAKIVAIKNLPARQIILTDNGDEIIHSLLK